jgi:DeoR family fructose operon transcriptional repressor
MLIHERYANILKILEEKRMVTVAELTELLNTSESTIRRDLSILHNSGRLYKIYGGATLRNNNYSTLEETIQTRKNLNKGSKEMIARYAAGLIVRNDFVYIDAGTTTELMIDFITEKNATYVTNGISHGGKLADLGFKVFLIGGRLKSSTAAIVGTASLDSLSRYNFTKGFFGTNGISIKSGFTTPDTTESSVKTAAMEKCQKAFVLADDSKFNTIAPISFASLSSATIITNVLDDIKYNAYTNIIEVSKL